MNTRFTFFLVTAALSLLICGGCTQNDEWETLFDGETLQGWKASENPATFSVENGAIRANGPRAHLFFVGEDGNASFKNFEFEAEVKTEPNSNSGIFIHTTYQDSGWPQVGYEAQVFNERRPIREPGEYREYKMTGSLYGIRNTWKAPVKDGEWFHYAIKVQGKTVQIRINGDLIVDYTESATPPRSNPQQVLSSGTFALQGHDPESTVYYRNIRVKRLADDLPSLGEPLNDPELDRRLTDLSTRNFPLIDLHAHLKEGLTIEQVLERSRLYGITYGLAVNCGLQMTCPTEDSLKAFLDTYQAPPQTYLAMQAEGREWLDIFSEESIRRFDYAFTDSMTWTNDAGKRMRLWIPEETEVGDPQKFMDTLVNRLVGILDNEPIQIYVNPTFLPDEINDRYDELWTEERMNTVVEALARNQIAFEINDRRRIPSQTFITKAKAAGVKFTFGTNNAGPDDLGHLAYCLEMIDACGLEPSDMWLPEGQ